MSAVLDLRSGRVFYECDACGRDWEERVYTDSVTGLSMCLDCLYQHPELVGDITQSPSDEGDNLPKVIKSLRKENDRDDEEEE